MLFPVDEFELFQLQRPIFQWKARGTEKIFGGTIVGGDFDCNQCMHLSGLRVSGKHKGFVQKTVAANRFPPTVS